MASICPPYRDCKVPLQGLQSATAISAALPTLQHCPPFRDSKVPPQGLQKSHCNLCKYSGTLLPLEWHFGVPEGWADGGYQKIPSNTMIKVGCVIYCENPVS